MNLHLMQLSNESKSSNYNKTVNLFLFSNFNQFFTPLFASLTVVSYGRARLWWS